MVEIKNFLKGIAYTVFAGVVGVGGYMIGKYKHMGGRVSLTMIGLAAVLYAPKGCEVIETYIKEDSAIERARIIGETRKDSIDSIVLSKQLADSTNSKLRTVATVMSSSRDSLKNAYSSMLHGTEAKYERLIKQNDVQYNAALQMLKDERENLQTAIAILKGDPMQKSETDNKDTQKNMDVTYTKNNLNSSTAQTTSDRSIIKPAEGVYVGQIENYDLFPEYVFRYYGDGRIEKLYVTHYGDTTHLGSRYGPRLIKGRKAKDILVKTVRTKA